LTALKSLDLSGTTIDNIAPLTGLSGRQELDLTGTRVPTAQATKLHSPFARRITGSSADANTH
jgi:hypothetical protein